VNEIVLCLSNAQPPSFSLRSYQRRKLKIEKARFSEEKRSAEEHIVATEQKMSAAVHISIQKVKFLQLKLLESKQENEVVSLKLDEAKATIERLRNERSEDNQT
jgi:hypothetical protein